MSRGSCQGLWLYGSQARGEHDCHSDLDLLWVANETSPRFPYCELQVSAYTWAEIESMALYGSLFLVHIREESKLLWTIEGAGDRMSQILASMPPYSRLRVDIAGFTAAIEDIKRALGYESMLMFEAANLATIIRHASILGCYLTGRPCFSRVEPVGRFAGDLLPHEMAFDDLYNFRLYADHRIGRPRPITLDVLGGWLAAAQRVIARLKEMLNDQRRVPQ